MPTEAYWLQLEAEARATALRTTGDAWARLADLYRENAAEERKRITQQITRS